MTASIHIGRNQRQAFPKDIKGVNQGTLVAPASPSSPTSHESSPESPTVSSSTADRDDRCRADKHKSEYCRWSSKSLVYALIALPQQQNKTHTQAACLVGWSNVPSKRPPHPSNHELALIAVQAHLGGKDFSKWADQLQAMAREDPIGIQNFYGMGSPGIVEAYSTESGELRQCLPRTSRSRRSSSPGSPLSYRRHQQ